MTKKKRKQQYLIGPGEKREPIDETGPRYDVRSSSMDPVHYLKTMVKTQLDEAWAKHVKEAEHQDGESFWANFANPREAFVDFVRTLAQATLPELQQQEEQAPAPVEQSPNRKFRVGYSDASGNLLATVVEAPTKAHAKVEFQRQHKSSRVTVQSITEATEGSDDEHST